jgi:hypothetical protein
MCVCGYMLPVDIVGILISLISCQVSGSIHTLTYTAQPKSFMFFLQLSAISQSAGLHQDFRKKVLGRVTPSMVKQEISSGIKYETCGFDSFTQFGKIGAQFFKFQVKFYGFS